MYLRHSSGAGVYLGKRMGWGWYGIPEDLREKLAELFCHVEQSCQSAHEGDDFEIVMEDAPYQDQPVVQRTVDVDGLLEIKLMENEYGIERS